MSNPRSGFLKTNLSGESSYKSFTPVPLPPNPPIVLDDEAHYLLLEANKQIVKLNILTQFFPNADLFVTMCVRKEALMSSQIEGIRATLEDALDPYIKENANRNVADVINLIKAADFALAKQEKLPLCNRLIRETHEVLMEGVRGQEKNPGEYRRSQNWIGGQGSNITNARYVPPNVEDMNDAMNELEKYMNADDEVDSLVRAALIHYQFETIHPFLDGNGRIGRLLITLFLMDKGTLGKPNLYISYFLKRNRAEYYER
ncbi:MAG: Fic family protein, partial [Clostridiales bacterium]|nr:Fic family protein [Clostridiales bacterium]